MVSNLYFNNTAKVGVILNTFICLYFIIIGIIYYQEDCLDIITPHLIIFSCFNVMMCVAGVYWGITSAIYILFFIVWGMLIICYKFIQNIHNQCSSDIYYYSVAVLVSCNGICCIFIIGCLLYSIRYCPCFKRQEYIPINTII